MVELRLAPVAAPSSFLQRRFRRLWELTRTRPPSAGSLLVTEEALVLNAPALLRGRMNVPWSSIRKAVVDDGARWGHVSEVCRFPVYAVRPDGSGHGTLIGPLWSNASSLMPGECPVSELNPVPAQPPNLVLILDPAVKAPTMRGDHAPEAARPGSVVCLLVQVADPDAAREAIAPRTTVGDVDQADLDYLSQCGDGRASQGTAGAGAA